MPRKDEMDWGEMHRMRRKRFGLVALIVGLLIIINYYWPFISWIPFLGLALVVIGLIRLLMPSRK